MISLKEAITKAKDYVSEVYAGEPLPQLRLEEVRREDGEDTGHSSTYWLITIGFQIPMDTQAEAIAKEELQWNDSAANFFETLLKGRRVYKIVKINANTGEVESMTNRAA